MTKWIQKLKIPLGAIFAAISAVLVVASKEEWYYPLAAGLLAMGTVVLIAFPLFGAAIPFFNLPLYLSILPESFAMISLLLNGAIVIITIAIIWAQKRIVLPKIDPFTVVLFVFAFYILLSFLWTNNVDRATWKYISWITLSFMPLILMIIIQRSGMSYEKLPTYSIIVGIVLLIFSYITLQTSTLMNMQRFAVGGQDIMYARVLGFLFICCLFVFDKASAPVRIVAVIVSLASIYFMVLAATRAPFGIALMVGGAYMMFRSRVPVWAKIIMMILAASGVIYFLMGSYMFMRIISTANRAELSTAIRVQIWINSWRALPSIPFIGLGFGGFGVIMTHSLREYIHPHNNFLEMFIELGWPGLLMYIFLMIVIPWRTVVIAWKNRRRIPRKLILQIEFALLIWFLGFGNSLINDASFSAFLDWTAVGMLYALYEPVRRELGAAIQSPIEHTALPSQ